MMIDLIGVELLYHLVATVVLYNSSGLWRHVSCVIAKQGSDEIIKDRAIAPHSTILSNLKLPHVF